MAYDREKKKIRIVVIGGIRTHYIKIGSIQAAFKNMPIELQSCFDVIYVDVAQHYDYALTCHIKSLGVHFDYTLKHKSKDSYNILSDIFVKLGLLLDDLSKDKKIDYVIVMGDVATTAVASLVALIKSIKLIHVEGGVRIKRGNGNEEYYRTLSDHCSSLCFAATKQDYYNLAREGFANRAVFSGDIMYDYVKENMLPMQTAEFEYLVNNELQFYRAASKSYILASLHHVENIDEECLKALFMAIDRSGYVGIFIAHPRIRRFIQQKKIDTKNVIIADGIPYLDNLKAIKSCAFCLTDSGGIQREAYYFDKRCIVRSDLTIWAPIVDIGSNIVVGNTLTEIERGFAWAKENMDKNFPYDGCFGDGRAVETIFQTIYKHYYETV